MKMESLGICTDLPQTVAVQLPLQLPAEANSGRPYAQHMKKGNAMRLFICMRRFSATVLEFLAERMPLELKPWAAAMRTELDFIEGTFAPLAWTFGSVWALFMAAGSGWLVGKDRERPWAVRFVAVYYAVFSCEIAGAIAWQLIGGKIHGTWQDSIFPLLFCFLLALLPGVIAIGLWLLDDAARWMAVLFAVLHAVVNWAWMSNSEVRRSIMPSLRIAMDVLAIFLLNRPIVRNAFRDYRIDLRLKD